MNEKLPYQLKEFSVENCPNGSLAKVAKFHTNPYNFVACLPNPYKLSILDDDCLKGNHFAIFLLQILLFVVKTSKFS